MPDLLLEIRDLKIGATIHPPGEKPRDIVVAPSRNGGRHRGRVCHVCHSDDHGTQLRRGDGGEFGGRTR